MGEGGYKIHNQQAIYFITFVVVNWENVFTKQEYKDIVVESLRYCQKEKGLVIHCWIIMVNHVHLIISAKEGYVLSSIVRDFKKYTSAKITHAIESNCSGNRWKRMLSTFKEAGKINIKNENYQFWQQDNHPKELTENEMMDQKLEYIHNNPVVKSIVENPEDYLYSSAKNYVGEKGLLEIEFME